MVPVTRRLSGDSDSSTASSKGGGGGRHTLGGASRRSGDEVVLLVNRKEGKHMIERPAAGHQSPSLRPSLPRARSQSRERSGLAPILKPNPPQGSSDGTRPPRTERGRSLGNEGPRRLHAARSHSQSKVSSRTRSSDPSPGPTLSCRDPQPPPTDRREEIRPKQVPPSSPRVGGGFAKRQSSSCSNSPIKGVQSTNSSPNKKTITTPRPPAPRSPSVGKGRLLPPVSSGGRRSPHSSPRNSHHHATRSPRVSQSPRSAGRGHPRNWSGLERQECEEEGFGFQMLPTLDPQKEQDLFRSFEVEFLANTQQARGGSVKPPVGPTIRGPGTHLVTALTDPNVTDSAYSSSNSSTSSLNVGAKIGTLPDLRESKRNNPRHFPMDNSLNLLYGHNFGGHNIGQGETEHWGERGGGLKKLPAISSSMEEREIPSSLPGLVDTVSGGLMNQIPSQSVFHCRNMNGDIGGCPPTGGLTGQLGWGTRPEGEGDVPLENHQPNLPYDLENGDGSDDLPPPEACPSPVALPPSEDCSFQDSSSETSSMCFSLSESRSESPQPSSPITNGNTDVLQSKKVQKKANKVDSKHKLGARFRPRTDNRPENSPSRIPTPVGYRDLQAHNTLSPCHTPPLSPQSSHRTGRPATCKILHQAFADMIHPQPRSPAMGNKDCSYPGQSSSLDTEAWM